MFVFELSSFCTSSCVTGLSSSLSPELFACLFPSVPTALSVALRATFPQHPIPH